MAAPQSTGNRHTEAYDQKLREILHVAARVMAKRGYHGASIRSLAAETDMTLAGLYYYFKGKEELLFLIQHSTFDSLVASLAKRLTGVSDPVEKLNIMVRNHLDFFVEHMDELKICTYELESLKGEYYEQVADRRREYFQFAHDIVNELIEKGTPKGVDSRLATLSLFGTLNWIFMWYEPGKYAGVDEMSQQLTRLYLHGLSGGPANGPLKLR